MKRILLIALTFIFTESFSQEVKKEIEVKKVTVYLKGAKVTGNMLVNLQKGKNLVRITNLPNDLDENTYKISLNKNSTLLAVTPVNNYLKEDQLSAPEEKLKADKKTLQRNIDLLNIQINTLNGEKGIINSNLSITHTDKFSSQEQLVKLTEFYNKRMLEIDNRLFNLNEQKDVLAEQIAKLDAQSREEQTHKNNNRKELLLEIQADQPNTLDLGVSYVVADAGWVPSYDLRAENTKKPLEMVYKGRIYQKTGQDWNNVKLYVSTYQPNYNQDRPILHPLYVRDYVASYSEDVVNGKLMLGTGSVNSYQMREKAEVADKKAEVPVTTVTENQMNILYELVQNQTIVSQEKEQYVILDKRQINATYKYHTVPKVNSSMYLMAFVKNWQNLNLISGEANIYFDDNYVGKTTIASNYVKDEFPISLGIDDRIVVKRIKLEDKNTEKALSSTRKNTETYEISIRNNTKENINLEVLDQLPISENNKISVKSLELNNGDWDEKTGSILWNRDIASGITDKIKFSYEVKYPKDIEIQYYSR